MPLDRMPNRLKRFFAGHLASEVKHPEALLDILKSILTMPVYLEEFVGRWLVIEDRTCCEFIVAASQRLGRQATLDAEPGKKINKFRLRRAVVHAAVPRACCRAVVCLKRWPALLTASIGGELDWDMNLVWPGEATLTRRENSDEVGVDLVWQVPVNADLDDLQLNPSKPISTMFWAVLPDEDFWRVMVASEISRSAL